MEARLPAHIEAAAIRRVAESQGGFATVLARGEHDAGSIVLVLLCRGEEPELFERMPQMDGNRIFARSLKFGIENKREISAILEGRRRSDPDLWLIEVDVPDKERFVAALP
ncbi:DUF1491 family protein [Tsuneonella deserti]|uniref:DUF1491 family protein n=1 Tax=Tsuneonella deserti TaxID=2035528 RepID=UPI00166831CA|nr:DUF1491 family protein [Tsuneonella deserti]